jgi:outer membrane protein OmpA-like peptidoglycan-associated protein
MKHYVMWYCKHVGLIMFLSLLAAGCVIRDPQDISDLQQAREAIMAAEQAGAEERFPAEFATLEQRHLEARGVFYACQDDEASRLARQLIADAKALAMKRVVAVPPPPNLPPQAVLAAPAEGEVDEMLQFSSAGSADPEGAPLTYVWDFGDQTGASLPNPTHAFSRPGSYTVQLTVRDDQGNTDTDVTHVSVIRRVVLQEGEARVFFDFDKATLKPAAREVLADVVQDMRSNARLRAELVGHADSTGPANYNMGLSQRRAEAVRNYLVDQGIPAAHLSLDWKGETQPIAPNTTRAGRAQNRRVEITVRPLPAQ